MKTFKIVDEEGLQGSINRLIIRNPQVCDMSWEGQALENIDLFPGIKLESLWGLRHCSFEESFIQNVRVQNVAFTDCTFKNAIVRQLSFVDCVFQKVNFIGMSTADVVFNKCDFRKVKGLGDARTPTKAEKWYAQQKKARRDSLSPAGELPF